MQNFFKLVTGAAVLPITEKVVRTLGADWEYDAADGSPCLELARIALRGHDNPGSFGMINLPTFKAFPKTRDIALDIMRLVDGVQLGEVSLTMLQPGGKTMLHDHSNSEYFGFYTRFHLVLQGLPGAHMVCGDETAGMVTGDVWWLNPTVPHQSVNNSQDDLLRLAIDIRVDK